MFFLGLSLGDAVPGAKTIWLFQEQLTEAGLIERAFRQFDMFLRGHGFSAAKGQIVDDRHHPKIFGKSFKTYALTPVFRMRRRYFGIHTMWYSVRYTLCPDTHVSVHKLYPIAAALIHPRASR